MSSTLNAVSTASSVGRLSARSSAFATPASASLLRATPRTIVVPRASVVVSAKGKSSRRSSATPNMPQQPPTPPVDPDNAEFIIFVRSKKLPSWIPFTLIKSGATANVLVKTLETTPDNQTVKDTLIRNIGNALYGDDYAKINAQAKRLLPQLKFAKELEYGFKIRDKTAPKDWYIPKNIFFIPPKDELPGSPIDNFKEGFSNLFGGAKK